jgi:Flp pilus assembly protein TadG
MESIPEKRQRKRGSETLEFGLVLLPMLGFVFLILDLSWAVFARATLQFAVREGCRYAITGQTSSGSESDSIKQVVQSNAMGLLGGTSGLSKIQVTLRDSSGNDITGTAGANAYPNIVEVSVQGLNIVPLFPLYRPNTPLSMSATSSDVMNTPSSSAPAW